MAAVTKYRILTARSVAGHHGYVVQKKGWWFWTSVSHVFICMDTALAHIESLSKPTGVVVWETEP